MPPFLLIKHVLVNAPMGKLVYSYQLLEEDMLTHESSRENWKEPGLPRNVSLLLVAWSPKGKKEDGATCAKFLFPNSPIKEEIPPAKEEQEPREI